MENTFEFEIHYLKTSYSVAALHYENFEQTWLPYLWCTLLFAFGGVSGD